MVLFLGFIIICGAIWFIECHRKAAYFQDEYLAEIFARQDRGQPVKELADVLDSVPFKTHRWYLFTFRNPSTLYKKVL